MPSSSTRSGDQDHRYRKSKWANAKPRAGGRSVLNIIIQKFALVCEMRSESWSPHLFFLRVAGPGIRSREESEVADIGVNRHTAVNRVEIFTFHHRDVDSKCGQDVPPVGEKKEEKRVLCQQLHQCTSKAGNQPTIREARTAKPRGDRHKPGSP